MTTELHSAVQQLTTALRCTCVCVCVVSLFIISTVSFVRFGTKQNNGAETRTTRTDCSVYFNVSFFSPLEDPAAVRMGNHTEH